MFNSLASLASVTDAPASLSRCPNEKRVTFSSAAASKTPQARSLLADAATKPSSWSRKAVCLVQPFLRLGVLQKLIIDLLDALVDFAHLVARLLADGAAAELHGADLNTSAAFREEAIGNHLLRQVADDEFLAALAHFDGDRACDHGLPAVQGHVRHPAWNTVGGRWRGLGRCRYR